MIIEENKYNILFMGTPEFAIPALEKLHKEFGVRCVVTVPDKPKGRGQQLTYSAVKDKAIELGIPVLQPISLKDENFISELKAFQPDIIVVIAFRILPPSVFNLAKLGTFNTCNLIINGNYTPVIQDNSLATPAPKLFREQCKINWEQDARQLCNFINGVSPIPAAWFDWDGKRYKVLRTDYSDSGKAQAGSYFVENNKLHIFCGNGKITILEIQPQDKKPMKIEEFLRGFRGNIKGYI
ncbi:MAG: hypothetical protein HZB41_07085 [Ignavibacteriae bacterium]|nr:hypothetical protein [Ignavibacteriota bacterium]